MRITGFEPVTYGFGLQRSTTKLNPQTMTVGIEPTNAMHNTLATCLLNHSDKSSKRSPVP